MGSTSHLWGTTDWVKRHSSRCLGMHNRLNCVTANKRADIHRISALKAIHVECGSQLFPILKTLVPHTGQTPCVAGLPFFMVICLGSLISRLVRHYTQYACICITSFLSMKNNLLLSIMCRMNRILDNKSLLCYLTAQSYDLLLLTYLLPVL